MQQYIAACGETSVMVAGGSFILGSLATVFLLVLLEMYRCYMLGRKE